MMKKILKQIIKHLINIFIFLFASFVMMPDGTDSWLMFMIFCMGYIYFPATNWYYKEMDLN